MIWAARYRPREVIWAHGWRPVRTCWLRRLSDNTSPPPFRQTPTACFTLLGRTVRTSRCRIRTRCFSYCRLCCQPDGRKISTSIAWARTRSFSRSRCSGPVRRLQARGCTSFSAMPVQRISGAVGPCLRRGCPWRIRNSSTRCRRKGRSPTGSLQVRWA